MTKTTPDTMDRVRAVIREHWGYDALRPLQAEAMRAVMEDRDSVVVLPTGGGKSLCFQAPALCLDGTAVVVSPLVSLMKDQVDALVANGIAAAFLNSTQSPDERRQVTRDLRSGTLRLLYIAPERLVSDHVLRLLDEAKVSFFAIDEAHCVSTWGHDFRPHYRELSVLRERFPETALHAFTATATERVRQDVAAQLGLRDPEMLVGPFDRPNLRYEVHHRSGLLRQVRGIVDRHANASGIVYCISRREVESLSGQLNELGYSARPYHAGLSDEERHENQDAFVEDRIRIIVATVAFGMGIDKPDVRYVVHAGMPKSLENYQQESGRAGRDGLEAECILFHGGGDFGTWQRMLGDTPNEARDGAIQALRAMADYCSGVDCRHRALVRHFGQDLDEDCGSACDVCSGNVDLVDDPIVIGQKILSSVHRQDQRFGADYTALVLKGSKDRRVVENGHDRLSTHGLLADVSKRAILDWIGQLVNQGFLDRVGEYSILKITESGGELLRGNVTPKLLQPSRAKEKKTAPADSWEGVDEGLFEALRGLRAELASDAGVPPYIVFGDVSLRDMARRRPTSEGAFLEIRGVGRKKCHDYGETFVTAILEYAESNGLDTNIDIDSAEPPAAEPEGASGPAVKAFPLFEEGLSVADAAKRLGRATSTTLGYLCEYLLDRGVTDPRPWVDEETAGRVFEAIDHVGPSPLRPIFEWLNGEDGNPTDRPKVGYDAIKIAAACWANRDVNSA